MTDSDHDLRFAAALSWRPTTAAGHEQQKKAIAAGFDSGIAPHHALALVARHRVAGLALDALEKHGLGDRLGGAMDHLRQSALDARRKSLVLALKGAQARAAIERAGIPCLEFKGGPLLSRKLYGDLAVRHCKDVDLMVPPNRLWDADAALRAEGWRSGLDPVWNDAPFLRLLSGFALRDIPYVDPATRSQVELHMRFEQISDPRLESNWWDALRDAPSDAVAPAEFLYLVVHGTKHRWNRLKWLGDIAAIVDRDPGVVAAAGPLAARLDVGNCLPLLARLLDDLHDIALPGGPYRAVARGHWHVRSCSMAMRAREVADMNAFQELVVQQCDNRFRWSLFGRCIPWRRRLAFAAFQVLVRPKDIEAIRPRHPAWIPLLPLVRVASILVRYAKHAIHPVPGGARR